MAEVGKKGRKILVAVDESEESMYALSWCLSNLIAPNPENTLVLICAIPPPSVYSSLDATEILFANDVIASMEKYTRDLAHSVMERAEGVYRNFNNIKVEKKVRSGDAGNVICGTVEKLGADILVMGSHGYAFFKRVLLGSVSDHCGKNVKCPVLIVKRPKN